MRGPGGGLGGAGSAAAAAAAAPRAQECRHRRRGAGGGSNGGGRGSGGGGGGGGGSSLRNVGRPGARAAAASLLTKAVLQPLDVTRTLLQAGPSYGNLAEAAAGVVRAGGWRGLYCGLPAAVLTSVPSSAIFFLVYEGARAHLASLPPPAAVLAAATAGNVCASAARCPPELVKQQLQLGLHPSLWGAISSIARRRGLAGFYQGYVAQLARDLPYAAVQFSVYEALQRARPPAERGALAGWWRGGAAGCVACLVTTPFDVAKTRLMGVRFPGPGPTPGVLATISAVWRAEGPRAFARGLAPRLLYKAPASAVFLLVYELLGRVPGGGGAGGGGGAAL